VREPSDAAQIVACLHQSLDIDPRVGYLHPIAGATPQRQGAGERRLDRTAPTESTAAIMDSGEKSLLQRIAYVRAIGEFTSTPGARQQLQRRLAVAILEVLATQPVTMRSEQQLTA
jgi:hypothetical protein